MSSDDVSKIVVTNLPFDDSPTELVLCLNLGDTLRVKAPHGTVMTAHMDLSDSVEADDEFVFEVKEKE